MDNSQLEDRYHQQFMALFAMVDAQQPEKGIQTLFNRAKQQSATNNIPYAEALEDEYLAAEKRTHARLALLSQCQLND
jgi:hypothetical protein